MIKILKSIHWNPPCTGGLKIPHTPMGTCRNAKNFEFCFDCGKNVFQWTKKNPPRSFWLELFRFSVPYMAKYLKYGHFSWNRHLRLKLMLKGPKLSFNLILNAIGVRLRSTGTHFDHNRYIIRIFIFGVFYRSLWSHAKVSDPLYY